MHKVHLLEAATLVSEAASDDGTWKIRLISEGKGSSGVYTRELLENHHHALDNVLSFKNHPTGWDGPRERDFTMIAGEVVGETWIEQDERGLTAVYGNYQPDPEYKDKIERYKDKLGLSIYIEGSGFYREDSAGSEEFVIDWFNPEDPYASIDVVIAPGARGKFMESMREVYSAAEAAERKRTVTEADEKRNKKMELEEKVDKALEILASLVADKAEKAAEAAQVTADAEAAKTAAKSAVEHYAAAVEAVNAAELFESQRKDILALASEGSDVSSLIESAKAVREEAVKAVTESAEKDHPGVVFGGKAIESATELGKVFG